MIAWIALVLAAGAFVALLIHVRTDHDDEDTPVGGLNLTWRDGQAPPEPVAVDLGQADSDLGDSTDTGR